LPVPWRDRQLELNREFGEPPPSDEPEFRSSFSQVGERSGPVTPEQAHSLPVVEIARRYRDWQLLPDGRLVLPDDGVPLSEAVAADPQRFAAEAAAFLGTSPTAVRAIFNGMERSSRLGRAFEWPNVLELATWTLAQRPIERNDDDHPFVEERAWEWTRGSLMRLLTAGLARSDIAPAVSLRDRIWPLIESVKDDPPENRAEAVAAAIEYANWLQSDAGELFGRTPEVASFLEGQLVDARPAHIRVYEELGGRLAFLAWYAPSWTRSILPRLMSSPVGLWNAAWNAHLRGGRLARRVFDVLRDAYVRAVNQLRPPEEDLLPGVKGDSVLAQEHLADHLIALYRWGVLEEANAAGILDVLFERATARVRRYALDSIGRSLHPPEDDSTPRPGDVSPAELERLQRLWTARTLLLPADSRVREELPAFGSWFSSGRFDDDWAFAQLEIVLDRSQTTSDEPLLDQDGVMSRLAALADRHPARVARILGRLAQATEDASWTYAWPDQVRQIVAAAVRSGDADARKSVVGFLDRLGAIGVRNVEELVGASHDLADPLSIPYFLWDQPLTVAQFRERLSSTSESERDRLLGLLLREAADSDVWRFTTPLEVLSRWDGIQRHLGRRRNFWHLLLTKWQEQGLLAR